METIEDIVRAMRERAKSGAGFAPIWAEVMFEYAHRIEAVYAEKARMMNSLYHLSVRLREKQIEFWGRHTPKSFDEMIQTEKEFDKMLTDISGGINPLRPNLPLSAGDVCRTISMINR